MYCTVYTVQALHINIQDVWWDRIIMPEVEVTKIILKKV